LGLSAQVKSSVIYVGNVWPSCFTGSRAAIPEIPNFHKRGRKDGEKKKKIISKPKKNLLLLIAIGEVLDISSYGSHGEKEKRKSRLTTASRSSVPWQSLMITVSLSSGCKVVK
jgi:hypothetical protein